MKNLIEKISILDEKLNASETSTDKLNDKLKLKKRKLLRDAYSITKDCACVDFACVDVNCSLCLRLMNGDWKFFTSLEARERLLSEIQ